MYLSSARPMSCVKNALPYMAVGRKYRQMRSRSDEKGILCDAFVQVADILMALSEAFVMTFGREMSPLSEMCTPRHLAN